MRILTVGGGSGGHVTPVLAIIKELKKRHPSAEIRFWCDRKFARQAEKIFTEAESDVSIKTIFAGKLRRYHSQSLWQRISDIPTLLQNIGDVFLFSLGFLQSLGRLVFWRPNVVFCKGGFVCLPVGLAATFLKIPLVIHDSDTKPGLTNRILSRFAVFIATGAPLENYSYPSKKANYVGIPVNSKFQPVAPAEQRKLKQMLKLPANKPLLLVTGGGLGARNINQTVLAVADDLLKHSSVIHICGAKKYEKCRKQAPRRDNYIILPFVDSNKMTQFVGAADIVIARAGATTMLELAAAEKAAIIIPNALLAGGHQLKNAKLYQTAGAIKVLDENRILAKPKLLEKAVVELLKDDAKRHQLGKNIYKFATPHAAAEIVDLIEKASSQKGKQ